MLCGKRLILLFVNSFSYLISPASYFIFCFQETSSLLKRLGTLDIENSSTVPDGNDLEEPVNVTGLETFTLSYKVCL